jgi:hypothetical protein
MRYWPDQDNGRYNHEAHPFERLAPALTRGYCRVAGETPSNLTGGVSGTYAPLRALGIQATFDYQGCPKVRSSGAT